MMSRITSVIPYLNNTLPYELISPILRFIPIKQMIDINDTDIHPCINEAIENYINNKLLSDLYTTGYLLYHNTYKSMIEEELMKTVRRMVEKYMEFTNASFNNSDSISTILNINFMFDDATEYYNGPKEDFILSISCRNDLECIIDDGSNMDDIIYDSEIIINKIYDFIVRTILYDECNYQISKITINRKTYHDGFIIYNNYTLDLLEYIF